MRTWMRLAGAAMLFALALAICACCGAPPKVATIVDVTVSYSTYGDEHNPPMQWGPEPVRKVVLTSDQLLVFEKTRVQAVPILKLRNLEWSRMGEAKAEAGD